MKKFNFVTRISSEVICGKLYVNRETIRMLAAHQLKMIAAGACLTASDQSQAAAARVAERAVSC